MKEPRPLSDSDKADLRAARMMEETMQTPGWKFFIQILSAKLAEKRNQYEQLADSATDGVAQVLVNENLKGAIIGLRLALELPTGILNQADNTRKRLGLTAGEDEQ